jgi:hypothetical protein
MSNWDDLAKEYGTLVSAPRCDTDSIRTLIGRAASELPKDTPEALSWFIAALQQSPQRWFVARVMAMANPRSKGHARSIANSRTA